MTQATVRDWSPSEGGAACLDDGTTVPLPVTALADGPFRFLRPGQRVRLVVNGDVVVRVDLP